MFDTAILTLVKNIKVKQKCLMNNLSINNEVTEKHVLHHMLAIGSIHYWLQQILHISVLGNITTYVEKVV